MPSHAPPVSLRLTVNGRPYELAVPAHHTLLSVLRDQLSLTGAKLVCDRGECGACTVLLAPPAGPAEPTYACLTLAAACDGHAVTTVEGLASADGELHPLQEAFVQHDAVQCGFCTPGQLVAGAALLARTTSPSDEEIAAAMSGNLCRCGTYPKIVSAIRTAGAAMAAAGAARPATAHTTEGVHGD